ncbi:MAG: hypothetical protein QNJ54_15535 [Prochloraceae cyanobacterium]|nr:hypothetical protein [Prochloraceae cyanobacterium]
MLATNPQIECYQKKQQIQYLHLLSEIESLLIKLKEYRVGTSEEGESHLNALDKMPVSGSNGFCGQVF